MEAPRRYSVSPPYSFVTVPTHGGQPFSESLRQIVRWATGGQPKPTLQQQFAEAKLVAAMAEEMEEQSESEDAETSLDETRSVSSHGRSKG
jgi:hypothetical protein